MSSERDAAETPSRPAQECIDWKQIAQTLAGALDTCVTQIEQMKGMFDDSDGAIQQALDDASDADDVYQSALNPAPAPRMKMR